MADVATSEILLEDLPTKTVIFAPSRATVVREINTTIQVCTVHDMGVTSRLNKTLKQIVTMHATYKARPK